MKTTTCIDITDKYGLMLTDAHGKNVPQLTLYEKDDRGVLRTIENIDKFGAWQIESLMLQFQGICRRRKEQQHNQTNTDKSQGA